MMGTPVPILLVAGFLGAGKTTVVNYLLAHAGGRRIAAVVNDFGAINIDAELIAGARGGVVSLANGCICCSLQGDLLRTLAIALRRDPRPDAIIIEASGVADPGDVVRGLMDPVIWREAPLETVLCIADSTTPLKALSEDTLLRAQFQAADIVALSKTDIADAENCQKVRDTVTAIKPKAILIDSLQGHVPLELVLPEVPGLLEKQRDLGADHHHPASDRFEAHSWVSDQVLSLSHLQRAIEQLAPKLARAKGLFEAEENPGHQFLFQLAGGRATLAPTGTSVSGVPRARIVFVSEVGIISESELTEVMNKCAV